MYHLPSPQTLVVKEMINTEMLPGVWPLKSQLVVLRPAKIGNNNPELVSTIYSVLSIWILSTE